MNKRNTVMLQRLMMVGLLCLGAVVTPSRGQAGTGTTAPAPEEQVQRVVARLKELNPGYDGKENHKIAGGQVTGLSFSTEAVSDISPVRDLTSLQSLDCAAPWWTRKGKLADLSPLKGLALRKLNCNDNPQLKDLSPLQGMPLTELGICSTAVSDLAPLQGMKLSSLRACAAKVADLAPLKGMPITCLDLAHTAVADLTPLKGMPVTWLDVNGIKITDISALQGMPMTSLRLMGNKISDLSPLRGMPLTDLGINGTAVTDLSPLKDLPLKTLWCDFVPARDAAILRSIKTLEKIGKVPVAEFWQKPENQGR